MKQIKKFLVALILVLAIFLVACEAQECPECENKECDKSEVCEGLIDPSTCPAAQECPEPQECPTCPEVTCPEFDTAKECKEAGYIQPGECAAGITAPESIEFYSEDIALGGTVKFEVEVLPEKAYQGLVWSSSDPSIATVAEDGTITGIKPGKVTITAKSSVDANVKYAEEVEVVEKGLLDYEIAEREKNAIVAALSEGYVSADFDLPTTWNASAKVVYSDPNGKEITTFTMPDLGEATSQNYALSGSVTYKDSVSEFNVTLKLVKVAEGKNDYEKVAFACEVAEAFLYEYLTGAKVEKDVFLPTSVYGVALNWATNKAYVLTADGKLTAPNNDTEVQFTITPKLGAASASKTFKVVAAGFGEEDKIEYLLKQGALANISGKEFVGSIPLPTLDPKFGIKLAYVSGDTKLISNDGIINEHAYADEKRKVTFTVTAIYNDLNSPNDAFTKVFDLDVYVAAANDATPTVIEFAKAAGHEQFKHVTFGGENYDAANKEELVLTLAAGWAAEEVGDEKLFKVSGNKVLLDSQYFRYHEASLKLTYTVGNASASYLWTLNVGIGAEPFITYIGGRSQSYQASANPAERGDSLQGFSKWDKYVGIVANNTERTSQQYWSEFSGYTAYVDIPTTGLNEVIYTYDKEGNLTVYPTDKEAHIRQQMFYMEFAVLRIKEVKEFYAAELKEDGTYAVKKDAKGNKITVKYPVLANKESVRSTYGGNFGSLYVNETANDLDIPVSALSMGGTFTDDEAMKTYTKSAIVVMIKTAGKYMVDGEEKDLKAEDAYTLVDDWGANTTVKREQTWALDGYRPAMGAAPKAAGDKKVLAEGKENVEYKFTFGIQDSQEHYESNYIQYGIKSTESDLWGTTYVVLPAYGFIYAWHSQTLYSFSGMGGGYIAGLDKSLPIYFSRYYRHAENEELSDYVRNDIRSYFVSLTGITAADYNATNDNGAYTLDLTKLTITFDDLGPAELAKIEKLQKRLDDLDDMKNNFKDKADIVRAVDALNLIIDAAVAELASQKAYADLTEDLFESVGQAYFTNVVAANLDFEGANGNKIAEYLDNASFKALLATAKRNYESLTAGQKELYDKGYAPTVLDGVKHTANFTFTKKETTYVESTIKLVNDIIAASDTVTDLNKDAIAKFNTTGLASGYVKSVVDITGKTTPDAIVAEITAKQTNAVFDGAIDMLPAKVIAKLEKLYFVVNIMRTAATTTAVNAAKADFAAKGDNTLNPGLGYPEDTYTAPAQIVVGNVYYDAQHKVVANPDATHPENYLEILPANTAKAKYSDYQLYVAKSFKDVKNDDNSITWGLDAFFAGLLKQEADKQAADDAAAAATRAANIAKTVTLANEIKEAIPGLPSFKEVKNDGLDDTAKATYNALMQYDATNKKYGKVEQLLTLYKTLGVITAELHITGLSVMTNPAAPELPEPDYSKKDIIIEVLASVSGIYESAAAKEFDEKATYYTRTAVAAPSKALGYVDYIYTEVKTPAAAEIANYYLLVSSIGNFSGKGEADSLNELLELVEALDRYAADVVDTEVANLPNTKNIEPSDATAVANAKKNFNALTDVQKYYVDDFTDPTNGEITLLENAIAAKITSNKIDPVAELIDNLPKTIDKVTLADEAAILAAKKAYDALNVTGTNAHDYRVDFDAEYAAQKTKLFGDGTPGNIGFVAQLEDLIKAEVKDDAAFKAAVKAFKETESIGAVNAETLAAAKDLIAKYEAVSGHALETFKDATKHAQADWSAENAAWAKKLYNRLLATVAAYEAYVAAQAPAAE